jgi:hypothetical protein
MTIVANPTPTFKSYKEQQKYYKEKSKEKKVIWLSRNKLNIGQTYVKEK